MSSSLGWSVCSKGEGLRGHCWCKCWGQEGNGEKKNRERERDNRRENLLVETPVRNRHQQQLELNSPEGLFHSEPQSSLLLLISLSTCSTDPMLWCRTPASCSSLWLYLDGSVTVIDLHVIITVVTCSDRHLVVYGSLHCCYCLSVST